MVCEARRTELYGAEQRLLISSAALQHGLLISRSPPPSTALRRGTIPRSQQVNHTHLHIQATRRLANGQNPHEKSAASRSRATLVRARGRPVAQTCNPLRWAVSRRGVRVGGWGGGVGGHTPINKAWVMVNAALSTCKCAATKSKTVTYGLEGVDVIVFYRQSVQDVFKQGHQKACAALGLRAKMSSLKYRWVRQHNQDGTWNTFTTSEGIKKKEKKSSVKSCGGGGCRGWSQSLQKNKD